MYKAKFIICLIIVVVLFAGEITLFVNNDINGNDLNIVLQKMENIEKNLEEIVWQDKYGNVYVPKELSIASNITTAEIRISERFVLRFKIETDNTISCVKEVISLTPRYLCIIIAGFMLVVIFLRKALSYLYKIRIDKYEAEYYDSFYNWKI